MVDEDFEDDLFDEGGGIDLDEELDELEELDGIEELDEDENEVLASDDSADEVVEESLEAAPDAAEPESFDDDFDETGAGLPPTATFDGDDDDADEVVLVEADDEDEDDAVREGEFVCRSCFMAKRESALADEERMLCLDCV